MQKFVPTDIQFLNKCNVYKMRSLVIFFVSMVSVILAASNQEEWTIFKITHGKLYRSAREEAIRRSIFFENLRKIEEHNKKFEDGTSSYSLGINQFADMSEKEFVGMLTYQRKTMPDIYGNNYFVSKSGDEVPEAIDWVKKGAVTDVKNQEICGSCWSFSTTGTLEGQLFKKTGNLISLSEQNLVDCTPGCFGCHGGYMDKALEYVEEFGIMSEDDYPYEAINDTCKFDATKIVTNISGYVHVKAADEEALRVAVGTVGPISVAVDAHGLQLYKEGIYNDDVHCGNSTWDLNHGILVVGYGEEKGTKYWKIKNSWGTSWGVLGYAYMSRNNNNICGIANVPLYPTV